MAKKVEVGRGEKIATTDNNNFSRVRGLMTDLNKHYGKTLLRSGEDIPMIHKVPFDEPVLDYVSDGGTPIGRFIEYLGEPHSGKTRNGLKAMSKFQKYCFNCNTPNALTVEWERDKDDIPYVKTCECTNCTNPRTTIQAMIDIEGTTDPQFMKLFGIDIKGVIYSRPDKPSQAVGIVDALLREPNIGLILFDSVGSMGSDKEVDTAIEDDKMNQNALFLNKAMRKWQAALNSNTNETAMENGATMIIVNQSYVTLSIFSTEVAQGGRGLRHGKGMSLKTRIKERNKDDKTKKVYGVHVEYKNEKNKTGIPYRVKEYYLNLDPDDADIEYCQTNVKLQYIELAIEWGILDQRGGWFSFNGKKWQGKASVIEDFDEDIKTEVDKKLYNKE
jgi:RecA/RadA recombinase